MNRIGRRGFIKNAAAAGAALGSGVLAAPAVWAQAYPNKPIKFIVPLAPAAPSISSRARWASACRRPSDTRSWSRTAPAPAAPSAWTPP